jgi:putative effector of murein hydrolase
MAMIDFLSQHLLYFYTTVMAVCIGFLLTVIGYVAAKWLNKKFPTTPIVIMAIVFVVALLAICDWPYEEYAKTVMPVFTRLLGYVTVALAIPLATIRYHELPIKRLVGLFTFATLLGSLLPMALAYGFHLSESTILAFATRAVTTPVALNVATLIHAPLILASFIVIFSGLVGAALSPLILRKIDDERAAGFALGLAAHAIGTAQAWQRSAVAGEYAAFGMAVNSIVTALWVVPLFHYLTLS